MICPLTREIATSCSTLRTSLPGPRTFPPPTLCLSIPPYTRSVIHRFRPSPPLPPFPTKTDPDCQYLWLHSRPPMHLHPLIPRLRAEKSRMTKRTDARSQAGSSFFKAAKQLEYSSIVPSELGTPRAELVDAQKLLDPRPWVLLPAEMLHIAPGPLKAAAMPSTASLPRWQSLENSAILSSKSPSKRGKKNAHWRKAHGNVALASWRVNAVLCPSLCTARPSERYINLDPSSHFCFFHPQSHPLELHTQTQHSSNPYTTNLSTYQLDTLGLSLVHTHPPCAYSTAMPPTPTPMLARSTAADHHHTSHQPLVAVLHTAIPPSPREAVQFGIPPTVKTHPCRNTSCL